MCRLAVLALAFLMPASTLNANWEDALTEVEILVTTSNKNGSERKTTIWIVVLDDEAFVRTSGTPWERNLKRDPHAVLTIAGKDYGVQMQRVQEKALIDRVQARFREKYGGSADRMARFVRVVMGAGSHIYRVTED